MFFELAGKGILRDYKFMSCGYKGKYDLYTKKGGLNRILEFKYDLAGLFRDFADAIKLFFEIDAVVIWELTEKDRQWAANRGIDIIENHSGPGDKSKFPEARWFLDFPQAYGRRLYVVEIKDLV